jgi:TatA/E family protein of Tat protein translocase
MFGIGFQEMLIILVVVLIFFGPKRLPDLAKSLGKGIAEFKKASEEVRKGIEDAVKEESVEEAPKPPEDLSAYGKAPGSVPAPSVPANPEPAPPTAVPPPAGGTLPDNAPMDPAPSTGAPATAESVAPGTATGETPVPPPRQG